MCFSSKNIFTYFIQYKNFNFLISFNYIAIYCRNTSFILFLYHRNASSLGDENKKCIIYLTLLVMIFGKRLLIKDLLLTISPMKNKVSIPWPWNSICFLFNSIFFYIKYITWYNFIILSKNTHSVSVVKNGSCSFSGWLENPRPFLELNE